MGVTFNIKRKIKINGREYSGVEEMPEDVRRIYQQAGSALAGAGPSADPARPGTRIIFNGQEFKSVDEMPPETRKIYESALTLAESGGTAAGPAQPAVCAGPSPKQPYRRIWIFFGGGGLLFALIVGLGGMLPAGRATGMLIWALALPLALIACALYTSVRHWRCPQCGAYLPTTSDGLKKRRCLRCGRPFEL